MQPIINPLPEPVRTPARLTLDAGPRDWRKPLLAVGAIVAFHLAFAWRATGFFYFAYLACLFNMACIGHRNARHAFYAGFQIGLGTLGVQMGFLWTIFHGTAVPLWCVLAFWPGVFVALGHWTQLRWGRATGSWLIPTIWFGIEYFRGELYFLRFSWFNAGYATADSLTFHPLHGLGMYGTGFVMILIAAQLGRLTGMKRGLAYTATTAALGLVLNLSTDQKPSATIPSGYGPEVAGMQLEFPFAPELPSHLDKLVLSNPRAELLILSEYTLDGPVTPAIQAWCSANGRYLVIGGKKPAPSGGYYNTAFVVSPKGEVVFSQAKAVPIPFFADGLPAESQSVWQSPWGKIGICICYDLTHSRVTDRLVRLGAQALIVPTMDVEDWGARQHQLHARVAPVRAAEYGIPLLRVASSGISQLVDVGGRVTASAPFPGQGAMLAGRLEMGAPGRLPLDRVLGPVAAAVFGLVLCVALASGLQPKTHS
jgi:apolipoprotein N-acyltransferase